MNQQFEILDQALIAFIRIPFILSGERNCHKIRNEHVFLQENHSTEILMLFLLNNFQYLIQVMGNT